MKRSLGLILIIVTMVSCLRHATETAYAPSPRLVAIDTLMQTRPDSALTLLLDSTMDDPYYQLLFAEALYKNYYDQINRSELLDAMSYFDSINDPFLSARCHYMNGVGYYEMDSVVPACAEYMKALEIMEEHFPKKELVGYKAKFMALAYTHLCALFSDQYLHDPAIYFGKQSLIYYLKFKAEPWHIAWTLDEIGTQYYLINLLDSASYYFNAAAAFVLDTNSLTYRDVSSVQAYLLYNNTKETDSSLKVLRHLCIRAQSKQEQLSRCAVIGKIFYVEKIYDSAAYYLNPVFHESQNVPLKKQAAEWLVDICECQGENSEEYINYLIPFTNQEENKSEIKSQLTELYKTFNQNNLERSYHLEKNNLMKRIMIIVLILLSVLLLVLFIYWKKKKCFEKQIIEERFAHEIKQKAISNRLKKSNHQLRNLKELVRYQEESFVSNNSDLGVSFLDEPVCKQILMVCNDPKYPIKSTIPVSTYSSIALTTTQKAQLKQAVNRHYGALFEKLKKEYPKLNEKDLIYCRLCLLGLNNVQIAALLQNTTSTIWDREKKLQKIFNKTESVTNILHDILIG